MSLDNVFNPPPPYGKLAAEDMRKVIVNVLTAAGVYMLLTSEDEKRNLKLIGGICGAGVALLYLCYWNL